MKKLSTVFLVVLSMLMLSLSANAQLLLYDDFTGLTTASNLAGQSSWTKGGSGPDPTVQNTTPLTYTGYNGGGDEYVQMPVGTATTSRVYKGFTSTAAGTNTFYYAALINISATSNTSVGYFMTLGDPTTGTNYFARLFATTNGVGYNIGASKQSNTPTYGPTVLTYGTTYLVVVRYTFVTGSTNDLMYVWINPDISAEPTTGTAEVTVSAAATDPSITNIGNFHWHSRGVTNPVGSFDAVRVAYGATSADAFSNLNAVLPVELSSFTSNVNGNNVKLNWSTVSELNNAGFDIERKSAGEWTRVANVKGNGTTNIAQSYSFEDKNLASGNYSYRLKQIDYNGNYEYFNLSGEVFVGVPGKFAMSQNYPNPFNPATVISYQLPVSGLASIKVFDMMGREVAQLVNEVKEAGYYTVKFDASKLSSGMYFYTINSGSFSETKKMMLVK
jgi:hypothetical protein